MRVLLVDQVLTSRRVVQHYLEKTFEMRVFPIAPHARQKVQITYYQELDVDNDWVTYVYPLATVASRKADQKVSGKFALSFETKSEVPIV